MTGAAINTNAALYEKLKSVMDGFNAPIRYAVAYGSGAYSQKGYDGQTIGKDTMVHRIGHRFHVELLLMRSLINTFPYRWTLYLE